MKGETMRAGRFSVLNGALVGVTLLSLANVASATPLTLVGPIQGNTVGPQSTSNPCIIAGTMCQQPATMGFNNFVNNGMTSAFNAFSTTPTAVLPDNTPGNPYTVSQLVGALGSTAFNVAIDVNTSGAAGETLQLFQVILNPGATQPSGTVIFDFVGPAPIGNVANNGNGFADFTLNTVNLAGLPGTSTILFHAVWNGASDGAESFFLVPTTAAVPEPATLLLLGGGLVGLTAFARRKLHR